MGVKNYLIDGVSCAGKTTVCRELQRRGSMPVPAPTHQQPSERPVEALKGLAELFAAGALTEEEFMAAKTKLLAQL